MSDAASYGGVQVLPAGWSDDRDTADGSAVDSVKSLAWQSYFRLLKDHVVSPAERHLAEAGCIGQKLLEAGIPEEEAAEMHEEALRHLADEFPDMTLSSVASSLSGPLMEMLMTYSLASRGQLEHRRLVEESLKQSIKKIGRMFEETINALVLAMEMRDPYTAGHQRKVLTLGCAIAREMGLSYEKIEGVRLAGLIHDIGKLAVPAEILTKPTRLLDAEMNLIKSHPGVGHEILKTIEFSLPVARIVFQHHERMDGSGYQLGLAGEDILIEARILGVADTVEAMGSHRPYRPALGMDKALGEIGQNRGILYDPDVADACIRLFRDRAFSFF